MALLQVANPDEQLIYWNSLEKKYKVWEISVLFCGVGTELDNVKKSHVLPFSHACILWGTIFRTKLRCTQEIFILFGCLVLASSRVLASHNKDDFLNELNGIQEINCYLPEVLVLREYSFSQITR